MMEPIEKIIIKSIIMLEQGLSEETTKSFIETSVKKEGIFEDAAGYIWVAVAKLYKTRKANMSRQKKITPDD